MTEDTKYPLIETYKHKAGDEFLQTVAFEGFDDVGASLALPLPTRASLHIRDEPGGDILAELDSDSGASPDGTISIAATATNGFTVTWRLPGSVSADWDPGLRLVGDLQFMFAAGADLPIPYTAGEIEILTYIDNTEVDNAGT
jgi:hypothetical protein